MHVRDYKKFDSKAYGLASGRYMETIGFQSISGLPSRKKENGTMKGVSASPTFARRYIDNNLFSYHHHTGLNSSTFPTEHGRNTSAMIAKARKELNLDKQYGCAPRDLWMNRVPYPDESSIFSWLDSRVVPEKVVEPERADKPRIIIGNTGAMRFDIFKGPFTRDTTYIVSPFTSGFRYIQNVPYSIADRLVEVLNNGGHFFEPSVTELGAPRLEPPHQDTRSPNRLYLTPNAQVPLANAQTSISKDKKPSLTPGYTTSDDAGDDGDDTLHEPITFYDVPPCFETRVNVDEDAEPEETVDVVYLEFIQPWMLAALRFLGAEYEDKDTRPYLQEKSFTALIQEWVRENWDGNC